MKEATCAFYRNGYCYGTKNLEECQCHGVAIECKKDINAHIQTSNNLSIDYYKGYHDSVQDILRTICENKKNMV